MATTSPSHRQRKAPAEAVVPNAVPTHGSDKASDIPWPVADTPGRPFIHPHRLAQAMGDRHAVYEDACRKVAERRRPSLAYRIIEWLWVAPTIFFILYFGWEFSR